MANHKINGWDGSAPDGAREELLHAVLELSGARGRVHLSEDEVIAVSGAGPRRFRELFLDLDDCYATAYEEWAEAFAGELLAACRREVDWPARFRAAMEWLLAYIEAKPNLARGAIGQAPAGGDRVQAARRGLLERLSRAVDTARRETELSRHSPPPATAPFIVGGIAWAVESALRERNGRSVADRAPDLVFFAVMPYFGEEVAWAERAEMEDFV